MNAKLEILPTPTEPVAMGAPKRSIELAGKCSNEHPQPIRVALVDDEVSMHKILREIFAKCSPGWTLDSYTDGCKALTGILQSPPHAVLMDISLPGVTGIECTEKLRMVLPNLPVVMLSGHIGTEAMLGCLMAGALGCLYKPASPLEIISAVKKSIAGSLAFCSRAEETLRETFLTLGRNSNRWGLTSREKNILHGIQQQKSAKEIAETLGISCSTVNAHTASVFKKLDVHSRSQATLKVMSVAL